MKKIIKAILAAGTLILLSACNVEFASPLCTNENRASNNQFEASQTMKFMDGDFRVITATSDLKKYGEGLYQSGDQKLETCKVGGKWYLQSKAPNTETFAVLEIAPQTQGISLTRVVMDFDSAKKAGLNPLIIERPVDSQKSQLFQALGLAALDNVEKVMVVNTNSSEEMNRILPLTFKMGFSILQE